MTKEYETEEDVSMENLKDDNHALRGRQLLYNLVIAAAVIVCGVAMRGCYRNSKEVKRLRGENVNLKQTVETCENGIGYLSVENKVLKEANSQLKGYAEDTDDFLGHIKPEFDSPCGDPSCQDCKKLSERNAAIEKKWKKACGEAGVDLEKLQKLQERRANLK